MKVIEKMPPDRTPPENFELLLSWLAPDRDRAGEKYEQIRRNLLDYFRRRDVSDPLTLTDEVILRVTRKVDQVATGFVGDPSAYFLAVARKVLAEWWRRPVETDLPAQISVVSDSDARERKELLLQSLEHCWAQLSTYEHEILFRYCVETPPLKLAQSRELLAKEINLSLNALRVMAHRLKRKVKHCIERLMENKN
jgi:DNA-directed RNA polymerase specialized sigma24 family protein